MANHKSALKRIRQTVTRTAKNKYYAKTMRNAIKTLRATESKTEEKMLPKVVALVDNVAKKNIIHRNKAANLKSGLAKHINSLA